MEGLIEELIKNIYNADNKDDKVVNKLDNTDIAGLINVFQDTPLGQAYGQLLKNIQPPSTPGHQSSKDILKNIKQSDKCPKDTSCPVDVREMESYIAVLFDLPGVDKSNINISINEENVLTLHADRTNMYSVSSDKFLLKERTCGIIKRNVILPKCIDKNNISAGYVDGVLTVKLNKCAEQSSSRKILIS